MNLEKLFEEIEENEIWSFDYDIMKAEARLSLMNPYNKITHTMYIQKIHKFFWIHDCEKMGTDNPEFKTFAELSYIDADPITFQFKRMKLLKGFDLTFNISIEIYSGFLFIGAARIIVDDEIYQLQA